MNSPSNSPRSAQAGFTLLEMMIVIGILLMLTTLIAQIQGSIFKRREDIAQEGNFYNAIRFSMNVLQRDILHLFTPLAFAPQVPAGQPGGQPGVQAPAQPASNIYDPNDSSGRATKFWSAAIDATGIRPSRFQGTEATLSFISSSHIRIYKNAQESDFAKISYEMRNDGEQGRSLIRTEDASAFSDDERKAGAGLSKHVLLKGIRALKFRYWNAQQQRWDTSWDSDREEYKRNYPTMVEVQIDIKGPGKLTFTSTYIFRPEVPADGLTKTF